MSLRIGNELQLTIFGESHGPCIGITIEGLPAGIELDEAFIKAEMDRRAPGGTFSTPRKEADTVKIVSGYFKGKTTGAPLTGIIVNSNTHSSDYNSNIPRPSHSDYGYFVKTNGNNDYRGGGTSSGRLTAPLVFAGAICKQILNSKGIKVGAHILSIKDVKDDKFDDVEADLNKLKKFKKPFLNKDKVKAFEDTITNAQKDGDSVGGKIQCAIVGMPAGVGNPFFDSIESDLSHLLFSVPAVKGVRFGDTDFLISNNGSVANDAFYMDNGKVKTKTNHNGGILGGITTGMPILFEVDVKPTPSIFKEQDSVDLNTMQDIKLNIKGRHDPCILLRAVPVIEAVAAITMVGFIGGKNE